ncbi:hypothetical protein ACFVZW_26150 [Streptomyces sp. NPDC059567]|uniref:hypothetical protein n=1 Tax=Streptomyces sp. NPDC059567 TaxID=3346867 RepID=UPI0036C2B38E
MTVAGGMRRDLVRSQVFPSLWDVEDPHKRAVIQPVLSTTAAQYDALVPDFQDFVRTVRPDTGTGA